MTKRILIASMVAMLTIGLCAVQAYAYTELKTPVTLTSSGTLGGVTEDFAAVAVDQATGAAPGSTVNFASPSTTGMSDSGRAVKIQGGTNVVDSRIIIYTENNLNSAPDRTPTVLPSTGLDGAGLVGRTNAGYAVPLVWGVKSAANGEPNTNENYVFDNNPTDGIGEVYVVDRRHTHSFTGLAAGAGLDNVAMFNLAGAAVTNTANDTLYPQAWNADYYDKINTDPSRVVISQALFKNIATIAYGIATSGAAYTCNVPNLTTASGADNVTAALGAPTTGAAIYVYIAADFRGVPAQTYGTGNLKLAIVQD